MNKVVVAGVVAVVLVAAVVAAVILGGDGDKSAARTTATSAPARSAPASTSTGGAPAPSGASLSRAGLARKLAGRRMPFEGHSVRIDTGLLACLGQGAPVRRRGVATWERFTCTQTVLKGGFSVYDITFDVRVLDGGRVETTRPRRGQS